MLNKSPAQMKDESKLEFLGIGRDDATISLCDVSYATIRALAFLPSLDL